MARPVKGNAEHVVREDVHTRIEFCSWLELEITKVKNKETKGAEKTVNAIDEDGGPDEVT
jgi:hypothetical protein